MIKFGDAGYDIECYPNFFCLGARLVNEPVGYHFEISERRNDSGKLFEFLTQVTRMIGFNNMTYDWPMVDYFLSCLQETAIVTAPMMYEKNQQIFDTHYGDRFRHIIWKPQIPQIDMFMLHHLERFNVGLKQCEMSMKAPEVRDLPFPAGTVLTPEQMDITLNYNAWDVDQTLALFDASRDAIAFRESLGPEWLNYNDGKIGTKTFENALIEAGVELYTGKGATRRKRQTFHPQGIPLRKVILPLVRFTRPANSLVLERVKEQIIQESETRGGYSTSMDLDGFHIDIKLGGIHGSLERTAVYNKDGRIRDFDVTSYYPSIAIAHKLYPAHLGPIFCDIYDALKQRRISLPDGHPVRSQLKFALNVPFGQSNEDNSIFRDPAYMLAITMNGQLMLCMLAEQFANAGVRVIQVNTDGVTIQHQPEHADIVDRIVGWWQAYTGMRLEEKEYEQMRIRDANNYSARYTNGKIKRIGAYDYEKTRQGISKFFQANNSKLVVARAAEIAMYDDTDPEFYMREMASPWDFLLFRKGKMEYEDGSQAPKNLRYYVSSNGVGLSSIYPKGRVGIHAEGQAEALGKRGCYTCSACHETFRLKKDFDTHNKTAHSYKITPAMTFDGRMPDNVDFSFYLNEVNKLIIE